MHPPNPTPQINVAEIARLYGGEMTYNAVENYLRKFRKEAKAIKEAAADREGPAPSPARPRTKKAEVAGVKTGRVAKKKTPKKVKTEVLEEMMEADSEVEVEDVQEEV
jgi:hypothetical protein